MTSKGPVVIKEFPQSRNFARRKSFLSEVRNLARRTYRPQLVLDIPESAEMAPDAIELPRGRNDTVSPFFSFSTW